MAPTPFQWKKRMTAERKELWAQILWSLALDGDITQEDVEASKYTNANPILTERLRERGVEVSGIGLQLAEMAQRAQGSLITRTVNGRLVTAIRLNTKKMPPNPFPEEAEPTEPVSLTSPASETKEPEPETYTPVHDTPGYTSVGDLAAELVDIALRLAFAATDSPAPDVEILARLGEARDEAARQRKRADDLDIAVQAQRARIRTQDTTIETLQRNMKAKLRGDDSAFRELDKQVRAVPSRR